MKIEYIREFCLLAELKNFTLTAGKLFITQPTLSRHMEYLENELGVILLSRTNKGVSLTEAGRKLYPQFERLLEDYSNIESCASQLKKGYFGCLQIGSLYYLDNDCIYLSIQKMRKSYPNIELVLHSYQPHALLSDVLNKKMDMGLNLVFSDGSPKEIFSYPIKNECLAAMVLADSSLAIKNSISLKELEGMNLVFSEADLELNAFLDQNLPRYMDLESDKIFYASQVDAMALKMLECGGAAVIPENLRNMKNSYVKIIPLKEKIVYQVAWTYRKDNDNPAVCLFLKCCSNTI